MSTRFLGWLGIQEPWVSAVEHSSPKDICVRRQWKGVTKDKMDNASNEQIQISDH